MLDILLRIWEAQPNPDGYVFFPQRHSNGVWEEGLGYRLSSDPLPGFSEEADQYFTPLLFAKTPRLNENVERMSVLFADIDEGRTDLVRPSICWETSPGCTQGVWLLERVILPAEFNALNRDLTYYIKADRGGWHASKVLRVPNTLNWKRARNGDSELRVPRGRVLWDSATTFDPDYLRRQIPQVDRAVDSTTGVWGPVPRSLSPAAIASLRALTWFHLPMSVQSWLTHTGPVVDRSRMIWQCATVMAANGVAPSTAFYLLSDVAWNKYKDRPETLWKTVNKAQDSFHEHMRKSVPLPAPESKEAPE